MDSQPLLHNDVMPNGVVDSHGRPTFRSSSGRWTSARFIIGVEVAERFAFYGVQANLISYLTGPLRESTADAAAAVNMWTGVAQLLPLLGAFVADSYVGRYNTIVAATLLYILGLGMLTASSVLPALSPRCTYLIDTTTCLPSTFQVFFFYVSLYIMAFAQGGHKPCVQAFGADQFDQNEPRECIERSSFFNWWYFSMNGGIFVAMVVLSYIQDNIGWGLGFGIPCTFMVFALVIFLLGTKTYRFHLLEDESPFTRIARTIYALAMQKQESISDINKDAYNQQSRFADKLHSSSSKKKDDFTSVAVNEEEAKGLLQLLPIWTSCLAYAIIFAQSSTLFTKQGSTLDRRIGLNFEVPPAALQCLNNISIMLFVLIYDRILVPVSRKFTRHPAGITMLQRIGAGMIISLMCIIVAALVETKRLNTAMDFGLVDEPNAVIPMSLWWLVPQYVLLGISDALTMVGLQEFFYDQVPDALRSLGLALYLSIFGTGNFLSGFLISFIDKITSKTGDSWFSDNLNRGHLDYFYWLLAGLGVLGLSSYCYFSGSYVYKKRSGSTLT